MLTGTVRELHLQDAITDTSINALLSRDSFDFNADSALSTESATNAKEIVLNGTTGNDDMHLTTAEIKAGDWMKAYGHDGNDTMTGTAHHDYLHGGANDDKISGGGGNDHLYGDSGNDTLNGGSGSDLLKGGDGNDVISGGSGEDVIYTGTGHDTVNAGSGNDQTIADSSSLKFDGGTGWNVLVADSSDMFSYSVKDDQYLTLTDSIEHHNNTITFTDNSLQYVNAQELKDDHAVLHVASNGNLTFVMPNGHETVIDTHGQHIAHIIGY